MDEPGSAGRVLIRPAVLLPAAGLAVLGAVGGGAAWFFLAVLWYAGGVVIASGRSADSTAVRVNQAQKARWSIRVPRNIREPDLRRLYREAMTEQMKLSEAIRQSPVAISEIETELVGMSYDLELLCAQAEKISAFLASVDLPALWARQRELTSQAQPTAAASADTLQRARAAVAEQVRGVEALSEQRRLVNVEIVAVISALGSIRAETVRLAVSAESDATGRIREQVGAAHEQLRETMRLLANQERRVQESGADPL